MLGDIDCEKMVEAKECCFQEASQIRSGRHKGTAVWREKHGPLRGTSRLIGCA